MKTILTYRLRTLLRVTLAALLSFGGPSIATAEYFNPYARSQAGDPFPEPPQLSAAVAFWQKVFGEWRRSQIVLHDDEYLGIVYDVIALPAYIDDTASGDAREFAERRRGYLQDELRTLESRLRYQLPLDARQQQLLAIINSGGQRGAVYGASGRVRSQRGMRERFRAGVAISGRYDPLIRQVLRREGVPEDLAYLPHVESSFQSHARSSVGAAGVWQFMPATARLFMRMNSAVDERYDPVLAARGAARYLADAYFQLGDWGLAVTSYNHGVAGVQRARDEWGRDIGRIVQHYHGPAFGFASRNFYAEFLAVRGILTHLPRYFPEGVPFELPWQRDRVTLPQAMWMSDLARFFNLSAGTLATMNPALTSAALAERCAVPAATEIWLPMGTVANHQPLSYFRPALAHLGMREFEQNLEPAAYLRPASITNHRHHRSHARGLHKTHKALGTRSKHERKHRVTRKTARKTPARRSLGARGRLAAR